jgi:hypothetical protein
VVWQRRLPLRPPWATLLLPASQPPLLPLLHHCEPLPLPLQVYDAAALLLLLPLLQP